MYKLGPKLLCIPLWHISFAWGCFYTGRNDMPFYSMRAACINPLTCMFWAWNRWYKGPVKRSFSTMTFERSISYHNVLEKLLYNRPLLRASSQHRVRDRRHAPKPRCVYGAMLLIYTVLRYSHRRVLNTKKKLATGAQNAMTLI